MNSLPFTYAGPGKPQNNTITPNGQPYTGSVLGITATPDGYGLPYNKMPIGPNIVNTPQPAPEPKVAALNVSVPQRQPSTPVTTGGGDFGQSALIERKKNSLINTINQLYNDRLTTLADSERITRDQAGRSTNVINQSRDMTVQEAEQDRLANKNSARQNYSDLVAETRRRTRAVGGATNSGFLDLTSRLDQQLQSNLTAADNTATSIVGKANITAQQAIGEIETSLQKAIAAIEADKRTSAREKDQAIQQAEIEAANNAIEVQKWAASQYSRLQAQQTAQDEQNYQRQLATAYAEAMGNPANANINPNQILQAFLPALASTGQVGISDIQGFFAPQNGYDKNEIDALQGYLSNLSDSGNAGTDEYNKALNYYSGLFPFNQ